MVQPTPMAPCYPNVPPELSPLFELALDLRWSWSHAGDILWEKLNPELWRWTRNPWLVLTRTPRNRLEHFAQDRSFLELMEEVVAERQAYLKAPTWFEETYGDRGLRCVAYFCMEFGLTEALPLYSGGLGILAGDFLKSCSDLGVPVVGVGLLYQLGYVRQTIGEDGHPISLYPSNRPGDLPIVPVYTEEGDLLRLHYGFDDVEFWVQVWEARAGKARLLLLDLNDPANIPADRYITDRLYPADAEQRLQQEILIGIIGWQLLETLGFEPTICHLNEGHVAFAILERARSYMGRHGVDFETALLATRPGNLFTTHTPVEAGFDRYPPALMEKFLRRYRRELGLSLREFLALGRRDRNDDSEPFNMAYLAIRGSGAINGVSRRHREISQRLFVPLFPRWPLHEIPISSVTNGVHVPSWDSPASDEVWTKACGKERWRCAPEAQTWLLEELDDATLWEMRCENRRRLVDFVYRYLQRQHAGLEQPKLGGPRLNPDTLTLAFARRFTGYKRLTLLLHDPERLIELLINPARPLQIVISGKAHPSDREGQEAMAAWVRFIREHPEVTPYVAFLPDYDMLVAEQLVQGADLWLNTPRPPLEACGTSGMKVLVNGGLNLSELDGWWVEAYAPDVGWAIGDGLPWDDPERDAKEADQLYRLLEEEIVPLFYERDEAGLPRGWIRKMRRSMIELTPRFSAGRMVREYVEHHYLPLAERLARRKLPIVQELVHWRKLLLEGWERIHFCNLRWWQEGDRYHVRVTVDLDHVPAEWVRVELYAEPLSEGEAPEHHLLKRGPLLCGCANTYDYEGEIPANRPFDHYTARVVPDHPEAIVPLELPLIKWQR